MKYEIGDKIVFDDNFRGVNPRLYKATILDFGGRRGSKDDPSGIQHYVVKLDNGNIYVIDENMIIQKQINSSKKILSEQLIEDHDEYFVKESDKPFWYSTKHGWGPGVIPSGLTVVDTYFDGWKTYFATKEVIKTFALNKYDIKEDVPPAEAFEDKEEDTIEECDNVYGVADFDVDKFYELEDKIDDLCDLLTDLQDYFHGEPEWDTLVQMAAKMNEVHALLYRDLLNE